MLILVSGTYRHFNEGFGLADVAGAFEDNTIWRFLGHQFTHVAWSGCSFWDLIMPSFVFMVGVVMPYSYARRKALGHSDREIALHAVFRSVALVILGTLGFIFLGDLVMFRWPKQINLEFVTVLPQIGLAYPFAFLLLGRSWAAQALTVAGILVGYWVAFVMYPLPPPGFDYSSVGVSAGFERFHGLFAHWNKNTNLAADLDRWFLNLLPRSTPFDFNKNGLTTLNFIPTIGTMILGIMGGESLRGPETSREKLSGLLRTGLLYVMVGAALGLTLCPIVKSLWTPSWTIFSAGCAVLMLAVFFWMIDVTGHRRWAFPLVIVGMNSIAIYCIANIFDYWIFKFWEKSLGKAFFAGLYGPVWQSLLVVVSLWLVSLAMYQNRVFVRI